MPARAASSTVARAAAASAANGLSQTTGSPNPTASRTSGMGVQGRGDDHRVHPGSGQVGQAVVGRHPQGVPRQFGASLRGAGDDPG